ncbi:MAG: hypothetical protein KGI38_10990 [Thaumarchaeota archaeon]|nr:hypothetical protein [Nitrososphaerota archaeon]
MTGDTESQQAEVNPSIVHEVSGLAEEFGELLDVEAKEKGMRSALVQVMVQIQKSLGEPIQLSRTSLGQEFPKIKSAWIDGNTVVFVPEKTKKQVSVPLARLEYGLFMELVGEATKAIDKVVGERRRTHLEEIRPVLSLTLRLEGGQLAIFDWRKFHLIISNVGGDARGLYITSEWKGRSKRVGPLEVPEIYNMDVELGSLYQFVNQDALFLRIDCKDAEGNGYSAKANMPLTNEKRQKLELKPIQVGPQVATPIPG